MTVISAYVDLFTCYGLFVMTLVFATLIDMLHVYSSAAFSTRFTSCYGASTSELNSHSHSLLCYMCTSRKSNTSNRVI